MINKLLNYQVQDEKLWKIESTLLSSEERKKMSSAKKYIMGVEENVNKLDDKALDLKLAYEKLTLEQQKVKEQQDELTQMLSAVSDDGEANFLIKKAEEIIGKIKSINAEIEKVENEIKGVVAEYSKIKKTTAAAQAQYNENREKYKELEAKFKSEKESAEKELETLKKQVDPALLERYLKKRANKIFPIVYAVKGKNCAYCRMELSMADLNKLKNGEVIDCEQCGRMLYLQD